MNKKRLPENFTEYEGEELMSNYDGHINEITATEIKNNPFFSRYSGWFFNGKGWWGDNQWNCEIWQYHAYIETSSQQTLQEIMNEVSEKYGSD